MIYIIGKLITCALRICNCFWAWGSFWTHFEARTPKNDKNQLFHIMTCYISLESWKLVLLEYVIVLRLEAHFEPILKLAKITKKQLLHIMTLYIYHWKAHNLCFNNLQLFLGLKLILKPFWSSSLKQYNKKYFPD